MGGLGQNLKMEKPKFLNLLILGHLKSHFIKPSLFFMYLEINGLKYLKLTILRFLSRPSTYLCYSNSSINIFIVKTSLIIYKFTCTRINSHNFCTFVKCIFWGSNYFGVCGCWLVWLLLYVFMVVLNEKNNIFYQSFHHK